MRQIYSKKKFKNKVTPFGINPSVNTSESEGSIFFKTFDKFQF